MPTFLMSDLTVVYYGLFAEQNRNRNSMLKNTIQNAPLLQSSSIINHLEPKNQKAVQILTNAHKDKLHSANKPMELISEHNPDLTTLMQQFTTTDRHFMNKAPDFRGQNQLLKA